MPRVVTLRALLAVAICVGGGACGKKKSGVRRDAPVDLKSIDGMSALPAETRAVIGVDVGGLARSELASRAIEQLFVREPALQTEVKELTGACKIDVAKDIESVIVGLVPTNAGEDDAILVATGTFSENEIAACLSRYLTERGGRVLTEAGAERIVYRVEASGGAPVWLSFGSEKTAIIASSDGAIRKSLSATPRLSESTDMARLVGWADPKSTIWAAGRVAEDVGRGLSEAAGGELKPPEAMFGHLNLDSGIDLAFGVKTAGPEEAKKLISVANMQIEAAALVVQKHGLGPIVKRLSPSQDGPLAWFKLSLKEAELAQILSVIDIGEQSPENPGPSEGTESNVQRDAPPGGEAPARK